MSAAPAVTAPPVFRRASGVLHRRTGGNVLLLVRGHDRALLELTGSGAALWRALAEPRTVRDCAEELAATYDVPTATIEADIAPVLGELADLGALELILALE